ncbi:MAG: TolC family protein [Vulcanimicrobiaceae bacterium]
MPSAALSPKTRAIRSSLPSPPAIPERPLDGRGAVAFALHNSPQLLQQRAAIAQLELTYTRLRAGEFPTLEGLAQNQIAKQSNVSGPFAQFGIAPVTNFSQNTAELSSSYNLFNGSAQLRAQQAKRNLEGAQADLVRMEEQTTISVSTSFYALVADRASVALDEGDLTYQEELHRIAQASERLGRVAGVDVLRAEVAVVRSRSALVQARVDEANAVDALDIAIGASLGTPFAIPQDLPQPALPAALPQVLIALADRNRPEIASAKDAVAAADLGNASVDSDLRPTVALTGAFGSQVSPTNFVLEQQQIDAANAQALASYNLEKQLFPFANLPAPAPLPPVDRNVPGFWQFGITSTFQLPLYDYGARAAAHHAAKAQIEATVAALKSAYASVEADVEAALRNLDAASEKLTLARQSAALAGESARIAQLQYGRGLLSLTDTQATQQTALSAENDLLAAQVGYVTATIRLRVALAPPDLAEAADLRDQ